MNLTGRNPPQAAALEGERLGGFVLGFSQGEDPIEFIERMCYNACNVGFGCTVTRFGGRT
jgi:hypothetical protein